jgi:hypothetical protein
MVLRDKPIKGGGMSKGETTNNQNLKALKKTYTHKNPTSIIVFDKIRKVYQCQQHKCNLSTPILKIFKPL